MRHERRLTTEPFGNQRVRVRDAQHDERLAEAIDVRRFPRLTCDQILGDDPRFSGLIGSEIGVGQQLLRLVHRLLETAVDADFDEFEERGNLRRRLGHEGLEIGRRFLKLSRGRCRVDRRIQTRERCRRIRREKGPAKLDDGWTLRRVGRQQAAENTSGATEIRGSELNLGQR